MNTTLDYAHSAPPPPRWMLVAAFYLALAPLVSGVLITLGYLLTWEDSLQRCGLLCIVGGSACVMAGVVLLGLYAWGYRSRRIPMSKALRRNLWLVAALLILNFPAAFGCIVLASSAMGQMQVRFINQTATPITGVKLISAGVQIPLGDLPPGSHLAHTFRPVNERSVSGVATVNGTELTFGIDGYPEMTLSSIKKTVRFTAPATQPIVE